MVRNAMKKGLPRSMLRVLERDEVRPHAMLYAGLDLSRKRLDFHLLDGEGGRSRLAPRRRPSMVCAP